MVVLTYHRIPAHSGDGDFYAVHAGELVAQLDVLRTQGYEPGSFRDLLGNHVTNKRFLLTFDDATVDHMVVVAPLLEARGLRGTFFVPTSKLDKPGRMTSENIAELSRRGHEIGSHSHEHRRLDLMSTDQVRSQLAASLSILGRLTENQPRAFAAPGGYTNKKVRRVATECGMMVQRTMRWGLNENTEAMDLETIPVHAGMTAEDLGRILSGAGLLRWRLRYKAKEAFKQLLPLSSYEIVRKALTNHLK